MSGLFCRDQEEGTQSVTVGSIACWTQVKRREQAEQKGHSKGQVEEVFRGLLCRHVWGPPCSFGLRACSDTDTTNTTTG